MLILLCAVFVTSASILADEDEVTAGKGYVINRVVIDAGHGGHDHGTSGAYNKEKKVALDIALLLGKRIEQQLPEVEVLYTRKTDKFISLKQRAAYANRHNADFFISIHCNGGSTTAQGTETFVLGLHRNEDNLKVAMRENNSILLEDDYNQHYGNFQPNSPEAYIIFSLHQNNHLNQSLHLAGMIEQEFKGQAGRRSRGVKQAGFLVLRETAMPSILVETGFLTNKTEERFMASSQGKQRLSDAIYTAFKSYKDKQDAENMHLVEQKLKKQEKQRIQAAAAAEKQKRKTPSAWNWPALKDVNTADQYFIQLMVSSKYDKSQSDFSGIDNVVMEYVERGDVYKYMAGPYNEISEAKAAQEKIRTAGFRDAFVLRYVNGKRSK